MGGADPEQKRIGLSRDLLEMAELGLHDPEYNEIINKIKEGIDIKDLPQVHILLQFVRKKKKTWELVYLGSKLVPPRNARAGIIDTAHQGHFSPETIFNDLRKYYFWPEMRTVVEAKARACKSCRLHKKSKRRQQPFVPLELQAFEVGECWSVDIMSIGKMDFLVCVDRVSQYMMLERLPNKTGKACTKALKKWTTFLGIPTLLRSDGGPAFDCNLFSEFCKSLGIVHVLTSAYHALSNGQCERMVQEVRKFMEKSGERDPELVMKVLNNTERRGGLGTPMKIFMGQNVKGPMPF